MSATATKRPQTIQQQVSPAIARLIDDPDKHKKARATEMQERDYQQLGTLNGTEVGVQASTARIS